MSNETLFYICGVVLAVSALVVSFVGLKLKDFPGKALPLVILWFAVFVVGATTFAVRHAGRRAGSAGGRAREGERRDRKGEAAAASAMKVAPKAAKPRRAKKKPKKGRKGRKKKNRSDRPKALGREGGNSGAKGAEAATTLKLAADPRRSPSTRPS